MLPSERALDLLAIGDPVLDVVVRSTSLPTWDDKILGQSVHRFAGGSEANAACAISRLGLRVALFGDVGEGHDADFLVEELRRFGVRGTCLRRARVTTCATAVVFVSDAGERSITYVPVQKPSDRWEELAQALPHTRCIYTLPYNMAEFKRLSHAARQAGTLVAVDIERAVASAPDARSVLAQGVDIMFCNEAGYRSLVGEDANLQTATAFMQTTTVQVLVVTLGPRGAFALDRKGNSALHAAFQANVVDATGAGDTFNAAFLAAYLRGLGLQAALAQGCAAACCCIEAQGARAGLPTPEQVAALQQSRPLSAEKTTEYQVILDCDPGIDDALALFLAAGSSAQLDLLGVTSVAGNRPVEVTTENACRLLNAAGRADVPVYAGAARPIAYPVARCNLVHGEDGLGGVEFPAASPAAPGHAVDFIVRTLQRAPAHSVTIVAVGPLTNLALAEVMHPGILQRARGLVIMGGAVACPGNVTPQAEFNFYADPQAAQIVLDSGGKIELFGLDVTSKAVMSNAWIDSLTDLPGVCGQAAHQMLQAYAALDPLLHDACPVACLLQPELFSGSYWQLSVDCTTGANAGHVTGRPVSDPEQANAFVFNRVNCDGLMALVRERIAQLP